MVNPADFSVEIHGAENLQLSLRILRAGVDVTLVENDIQDRTRIQDIVSRIVGADGLKVSDLSSGADLMLSNTGRDGAVCLNWTSGSGLHVTESPQGGVLLEQIGSCKSDAVERLSQVLGAQCVRLPAGAAPVAAQLRAALSVAMERLMLAGASPTDVDAALVDAGFLLGPFEAQDLIGVDTALQARQTILSRSGNALDLPLFARAVAEGRLGRKVGVGWYRYPGNGGKVEDPLVEDMAAEEARFAGFSQTHLDAQAIVSKCLETLRKARKAVIDQGHVNAVQFGQLLEISVNCPPHVLD